MPKSFVIGITGPESTGKSQLSKELSEYFGGIFVEEYARRKLEEKDGKYNFEDLELMAKEQSKLWFGAILQQPKFIFLDTEMTVYKIWSQVKFGKVSKWIEDHCSDQKIDLYLLCKNDLKWQSDPLRETKNDEERDFLFHEYKNVLEKMNRNFVVIHGQNQARTQLAIDSVKKEFGIE